MQYRETDSSVLRDQLARQAEQGEAVRRMRETEGWKIVESHLKDQLEAYEKDNAADAKSWDEYLRKAGKIFGIRLLLVDIADFERQGDNAAEELDRVPTA